MVHTIHHLLTKCRSVNILSMIWSDVMGGPGHRYMDAQMKMLSDH